MNALTILLCGFGVPFVTMALFAPWMRDRNWTSIAISWAIIFAVATYLINGDGRFSLVNSMLRALIISLVPIAGGWAYAKWELRKEKE